MKESSRRLFRNKVAMAASLAATLLLLLVLVAVSLFFESTPRAIELADQVLNGVLLNDQEALHLDLKLEISPRGRIDGEAVLRLRVDPDRSSVVMLLHPELEVIRAVWDGQVLENGLRLGHLYRLGLPRRRAADGSGTLKILYAGGIVHPLSHSIFSPDLVYLDPDDCFYPRIATNPMEVSLRILLPDGIQAVISGVDPPLREGLAPGGRFWSWTLSPARSTFSVAGCRGESGRIKLGDLDVSLLSLGKEGIISRENLLGLYSFFQRHLPVSPPPAMSFIVVPTQLKGELRCDGADTVLFPENLKINDLAYAFALLWMPDRAWKDALFSREEMAMGWALYFIADTEKLAKTYLTCLEEIDLLQTCSSPLPRSDLAGIFMNPSSAGNRGAGLGGYLLFVLRRFAGNEAFTRTCREVLGQSKVEDESRLWKERLRQRGIEDSDWFLDDWASQRRSLDLAVEAFSAPWIPQKDGYQVAFTLVNEGDLELPEKVQVVLITEDRWLRKTMQVSRSGSSWGTLLEEAVLGVIVDPDLEWPDVDRSNNAVFLEPTPMSIMPSPDNRYLAAAFRRQAGPGKVPLMIIELETGRRRTLLLDSPAVDLRWISGARLLVRIGRLSEGKAAPATGSSCLLVEARTGEARHLGRDVSVSPSVSGRFLLVNSRKGHRWKHQLIDLEERRVQPFLNQQFYELEFIPGADLIRLIHPRAATSEVSLFSLEAQRFFPEIHTQKSELTAFEGFDGGVFFLGRQREQSTLYYLARDRAVSGKPPQPLFDFDGASVEYRLNRDEGYIYIFECYEDSPSYRVTYCDLDTFYRGKRKTLYEGDVEIIPEMLNYKGFVKVDRGGSRISYHYFEDQSETVITEGQGTFEVIALVGTRARRYLYYAKEEPFRNTPICWSGSPYFKRYTFLRYDFQNALREGAFLKGTGD